MSTHIYRRIHRDDNYCDNINWGWVRSLTNAGCCISDRQMQCALTVALRRRWRMTENMRNTVEKMRGHPSGGQCSRSGMAWQLTTYWQQGLKRTSIVLNCSALNSHYSVQAHLGRDWWPSSAMTSLQVHGESETGPLAARMQNCSTLSCYEFCWFLPSRLFPFASFSL